MDDTFIHSFFYLTNLNSQLKEILYDATKIADALRAAL